MSERGALPSRSESRKTHVVFGIEHTKMPTAGYDWHVEITLPNGQPIRESGFAGSWTGARLAIRRRIRKTLGVVQYIKARRALP